MGSPTHLQAQQRQRSKLYISYHEALKQSQAVADLGMHSSPSQKDPEAEAEQLKDSFRSQWSVTQLGSQEAYPRDGLGGH